ncbi:MAG TPA: FAD-binding protein, partial [Candidatus Cryosericum sp.]|nr:FAD-binding protein [Candidatus Cryosericum sp.]
MATKTQDTYDVLVVGSGASGGWAAKRLSEAGVKVALVDAGRPLRITDLNEHGSMLELPYRGLSS